jgi:undecaprenyl-diphosphatase
MDFSNFLDTSVIAFVNQFAKRSWLFDQFVATISINKLVKGGVLVSLLWWAWFRNKDTLSKDREHVMATLLGCLLALAFTRVLLTMLPFRQRPLHDASLSFVLPHGVAETALDGLSSFPSDHAVLFFALVAGLFFVSRTLGFLGLIYAAVFIAAPRVYLGLHFPTDILAGAAIGVSFSLLFNLWLPGTAFLSRARQASYTRPEFVYPVLFLMTFQIADLFESSRSVAGKMVKLFQSFA